MEYLREAAIGIDRQIGRKREVEEEQMKVYEVWFRAGDDFKESGFCILVKANIPIKFPGAVEVKEIEESAYTCPDIVIEAPDWADKLEKILRGVDAYKLTKIWEVVKEMKAT